MATHYVATAIILDIEWVFVRSGIPFSSGSAHMDNHTNSLLKTSEEAQMDRYTKMILTIIAMSLLVISLKDVPIISKAFASSVVEVKVVDMNWTRYSPLPVRLEGKLECK